MRRAAVPLALAAALAASGPASAYVREVSETTGVPLSWPLPVEAYEVNLDWPFRSQSCTAGPAGDPALDAIRASFAAWRQPCANVDLVYAGTTGETRTGLADGVGENVVVFRRGWCSNQLRADEPCMLDPDVDCGNIYGCFEDHGDLDRQALAMTGWLYEPHSGRIFDTDIQVNAWDGQPGALPPPDNMTSATHGWYFTCGDPLAKICSTYGESDCSYFDLQNAITHEVGHVLGLAHSALAPDTTMYAYARPGETKKRVLSQDDVAGVCAIYPEPSGCSSAGGGSGMLASILAALALRRRRS